MIILNKIYNEDCFKFLEKIPDNCVDLIIADPPYNIGIHKWDKIENYVDWSYKWLKRSYEILKKDGNLFLYGSANKNIDFLKLIIICIEELNFNFINWIIWCKNTGLTNVKNKFVPSHEDIIWCCKGKQKYNIQRIYSKTGSGWNRFKKSDLDNDGIIRLKDLKKAGEIHHYNKQKKRGIQENDIIYNINKPTNLCLDWWDDISNLHKKSNELKKKNRALKPEALSERIIKATTNQGDLILIPFVGLGSEVIVCKKLSRNFLGSEINKEYYEIANKRLNEIEFNLF